MTLKVTNFVALFLLALVTGVFLGNMVYADTVDRNFLAGGVHSHRQNDYRKCSVADENPGAGLYLVYGSGGRALSGKEVAGIFSQCGGLSSHHRCAADYSAGWKSRSIIKSRTWTAETTPSDWEA